MWGYESGDGQGGFIRLPSHMETQKKKRDKTCAGPVSTILGYGERWGTRTEKRRTAGFALQGTVIMFAGKIRVGEYSVLWPAHRLSAPAGKARSRRRRTEVGLPGKMVEVSSFYNRLEVNFSPLLPFLFFCFYLLLENIRSIAVWKKFKTKITFKVNRMCWIAYNHIVHILTNYWQQSPFT